VPLDIEPSDLDWKFDDQPIVELSLPQSQVVDLKIAEIVQPAQVL